MPPPDPLPGSRHAPFVSLGAADPTNDLINSLPAPILTIAPDNRLHMANAAAEDFFSLSQAQITGRRWGDLFAHDASTDMPARSLLDEARRRGGHLSAYDLDLILHDRQAIRADILLSPLQDAPDWIIVLFQRRTDTDAAGRRRIMHHNITRSAGIMAGLLAHEIKNPLSGIRGAAQLLADEGDEDSRDLTQLICAEVDRVARLIDEMEIFGDAAPPDMERNNIHEILGHVRQVAQKGFARHVTFYEEYDPSLPKILGHRDSLVQLFLNLVKNAAEALGKNPDVAKPKEIRFRTAYRHGINIVPDGSDRIVPLPIEICVIDNGPGVPLVVEKNLFDLKMPPQGTRRGFGLALVAKIIADHGGMIEYARRDDPPQTLFRILLPMAKDGAACMTSLKDKA